jgi:hypothetical protein
MGDITDVAEMLTEASEPGVACGRPCGEAAVEAIRSIPDELTI